LFLSILSVMVAIYFSKNREQSPVSIITGLSMQ